MYKLGRLLSAIVSQNISVLIVVGIFRALFGVYGWFPDDRLHLLVWPLLNWFVPVLFAYTGGQLIGGKRGGVVAATVIFGMSLASSVTMIFVALVLGPAIGWLVNRIDRAMENRLPAGFELLMSNFVHAAIATALAAVSFIYVGQSLSSLIRDLNEWLIHAANSGWLPVSAFVIETAKVMFLNNVVNYGIMGPLGISQIHDLSKSIFFLLEANPGPAIGMLLAYWLKSTGERQKSARTALTIHALGGIQEVYFPYVLMRPVLIVPLIVGSMAGIAVFQYMDAGLAAIASPSSLFLIAALSPRDDLIPIMVGIAVSAAASFAAAYMLVNAKSEMPHEVMDNREANVIQRLQHVRQWDDLKAAPRPVWRLRLRPGRDRPSPISGGDSAKAADKSEDRPPSGETDDRKPQSPAVVQASRPIRMICFACDGGLGSSAMGAAMLRKKLKAEGMDETVKVVHASLDHIPKAADLVITHRYLLGRAVAAAPGREYLAMDSFTDSSFHESILDRLHQQQTYAVPEERVYLVCEAVSLADAARQAVARLVRQGLASEAALDRSSAGRIRTERLQQGIALAIASDCGTGAGAKGEAVVLQFPEGVSGPEGRLYVMVGIAGSDLPFRKWLASGTETAGLRGLGAIQALRTARSPKELLDAVRSAGAAAAAGQGGHFAIPNIGGPE